MVGSLSLYAILTSCRTNLRQLSSQSQSLKTCEPTYGLLEGGHAARTRQVSLLQSQDSSIEHRAQEGRKRDPTHTRTAGVEVVGHQVRNDLAIFRPPLGAVRVLDLRTAVVCVQKVPGTHAEAEANPAAKSGSALCVLSRCLFTLAYKCGCQPCRSAHTLLSCVPHTSA
jgi:hypothetical protein